MHKRTYQRILGMLAYHEAIRKQGASYAPKSQISIALIYGGSVEAGLQCSVVGRSANLHLGSRQVCAGRSQDWIKVKNPAAPAYPGIPECSSANTSSAYADSMMQCSG